MEAKHINLNCAENGLLSEQSFRTGAFYPRIIPGGEEQCQLIKNQINEYVKELDKDSTNWKPTYEEDGLLSEQSFRKIWQTGVYRKCITNKDEYCQFIQKYVEKYGKAFNRDTTLYRASSTQEEDETNLSGGSWTTSIEDAFYFANSFGMNRIYSMVVPKGTKTIFFNPIPKYPEKENLIDTVSVKNESLQLYANIVKVEAENGNVVHYWRLSNGKSKRMVCPKRTRRMLLKNNYLNPLVA